MIQFPIHQPTTIQQPSTIHQPTTIQQPTTIKNDSNKNCNDLKYILLENVNSGNPEVWGPAFWFSLHNGAIKYPENPSPMWKERMKNFIHAIPVMLPCETCADHATSYIESQYKNIDNFISSRDSLFLFFCEFHNYVNNRLNKKEITISEAYKLYSNNFNVTKLKMN